MKMKLKDVYDCPDAAVYLYALLVERDESINISHKVLPTPLQHLSFIKKRPYQEWHLIKVGAFVVGAIYLTHANEIGIFIFKEYQGFGYGKQAIQLLMAKHKGERILANVNPANDRSREMFQRLGFKKIQETFALC